MDIPSDVGRATRPKPSNYVCFLSYVTKTRTLVLQKDGRWIVFVVADVFSVFAYTGIILNAEV